MDIDKLLESFSALSELLKTPSLQNQLNQDTALGKKLEEIEMLVERVRIQQGNSALSSTDGSLMFEELSTRIIDLKQYCDLNLIKLDFLENLKPLT